MPAGLDNLVVHLIGDPSSFLRMLSTSLSATNVFGTKITSVLRTISHGFGVMGSTAAAGQATSVAATVANTVALTKQAASLTATAGAASTQAAATSAAAKASAQAAAREGALASVLGARAVNAKAAAVASIKSAGVDAQTTKDAVAKAAALKAEAQASREVAAILRKKALADRQAAEAAREHAAAANLAAKQANKQALAAQQQAAANAEAAAVMRQARMVMIGIAAALIAIVSIKAFANFDAAMKQSLSIMKATNEQIERMKRTVFDLATSTGIPIDDLARGFYHLASAGLSTEQAIKALPVAARFATAGLFSLEEATILLTDAQAALGLKFRDPIRNMEEMKRISDVLSKANMIAEGTTRQFAEALSNTAAGTLRAFNKDVEEGTAVLAAYADQGIKGKHAGHVLTRTILLLNKSFQKAKVSQAGLKFEIFDSNEKMRNLADIIADLEKILGNMSEEQRGATLAMLGFEARAQNAILPLIGMSNKIREYESELRRAKGTTEEVAEKQLKAFTKQMEMVKNQVTILAIGIGEDLAPALESMGGIIKIVAKVLSEINPKLRASVIGILVLTAALMAIIPLLKAVKVGLIALAFNPFFWVAAAVIVLAVLKRSFDDNSEAAERFNERMKKQADEAKHLSEKRQNDLKAAASIKDPRKRKTELERQLNEVNSQIIANINSVKLLEERLEQAKIPHGTVKPSFVIPPPSGEPISDWLNENVGIPISNWFSQTGFDTFVLESAGSILNSREIEETQKQLTAANQQLEDSESHFKSIQEQLRGLGSTENIRALQSAINDLNDELDKELETVGMTTNQIKIWELAEAGATEQMLKQTRALAKNIELKEKGLDITKEFRPPQQKLTDRIMELNEVLDAGYISFDVYKEAVKAAKNELAGASKEAERFDAAARGSAEAITRIQNWRDKLRGVGVNVGVAAGLIRDKAPRAPVFPQLPIGPIHQQFPQGRPPPNLVAPWDPRAAREVSQGMQPREEDKQVVVVLKEIRDILKDDRGNQVILKPLALG